MGVWVLFGYVRVAEGELKIKDFGLYRGVFCGLCKTMKNNTGLTSPFTLTYDFVVLALLRSGISGEGFTVKPGKCIAHPFKKRPMAHENESLRYCAAVAAILTYYKLLDDKNDKDKNGLAVSTLLRQAKRNMKKAIRSIPQLNLEGLTKDVEKYLSELTELEEAHCDSADECASKFGQLLAACFSFGIDDPDVRLHCGDIGHHLGRWIYIIDLWDDFEKDKKKGSYNPLIEAGYTEIPEDILTTSLRLDGMKALEALNALPIKYVDIKRILHNILFDGLSDAIKKIAKKHSKPDLNKQ